MRFSPLDSSENFMGRGEVVTVFLYLLYVPSYDVINYVIMSDADCTPGREPRSVAASSPEYHLILHCVDRYLLLSLTISILSPNFVIIVIFIYTVV